MIVYIAKRHTMDLSVAEQPGLAPVRCLELADLRWSRLGRRRPQAAAPLRSASRAAIGGEHARRLPAYDASTNPGGLPGVRGLNCGAELDRAARQISEARNAACYATRSCVPLMHGGEDFSMILRCFVNTKPGRCSASSVCPVDEVSTAE